MFNVNWIVFRVEVDPYAFEPGEVSKMSVCGSAPVLGNYQLEKGLKLKATKPSM